jgi:hypothetical protein
MLLYIVVQYACMGRARKSERRKHDVQCILFTIVFQVSKLSKPRTMISRSTMTMFLSSAVLLLTLLLQGSIAHEFRVQSKIHPKNEVWQSGSALLEVRGGSDYYRSDSPRDKGRYGGDDRYNDGGEGGGDKPSGSYYGDDRYGDDRYGKRDYDDREYKDSEKVSFSPVE